MGFAILAAKFVNLTCFEVETAGDAMNLLIGTLAPCLVPHAPVLEFFVFVDDCPLIVEGVLEIE